MIHRCHLIFHLLKVRKDRAYTIQVDGNHREISIAAKVIEGLSCYNQPGQRENKAKDKSFVKALLISVCSIKLIRVLKSNQNPPKGMINFIRGYFHKEFMILNDTNVKTFDGH